MYPQVQSLIQAEEGIMRVPSLQPPQVGPCEQR